MSISIIHPSRQRPEKAIKTMQKALNNIGISDYEYILSLDDNDTQIQGYESKFNEIKDSYNAKICIFDSLTAIENINKAAKLTTKNIIVVLSDDFDDMPLNWGNTIIEATKNNKCWLLKTFDGSEGWIVTFPIMDRAYYSMFGYVYYPAYKHLFADTDMTNVAEYLGKLIVRNDILFKHNHHTIIKDTDDLNKRNDLTWGQGEILYLNRFACDFELKGGTYNKVISNKAHEVWVVTNIRKYDINWCINENGLTTVLSNVENNNTKLSILIATTIERRPLLNLLLSEYKRQLSLLDNKYNCVNIITYSDNKEISVGSKRQQLLAEAQRQNAEWVVFFDDDDFPFSYYIQSIIDSILNNNDIDCIGIWGTMTENSLKLQTWCHRIQYKEWASGNYDGHNHIRPILHFNPVKLEKALLAGYTNERYGEDRAYSERLKNHVTKECFIEKPLFHYRYSSNVPHQQKYGIK